MYDRCHGTILRLNVDNCNLLTIIFYITIKLREINLDNNMLRGLYGIDLDLNAGSVRMINNRGNGVWT